MEVFQTLPIKTKSLSFSFENQQTGDVNSDVKAFNYNQPQNVPLKNLRTTDESKQQNINLKGANLNMNNLQNLKGFDATQNLRNIKGAQETQMNL